MGPALFEPPAAAQFLAQLLGDNLRVPRKPVSDPNRPVNLVGSEFEGRIGSRVLPEWIDVLDDPTQSSYDGKPLAGYYAVRFGGCEAPSRERDREGVLKNFFTTRQPMKDSAGRMGMRVSRGVRDQAAAIGNLFVKPAESTPLADLKTATDPDVQGAR